MGPRHPSGPEFFIDLLLDLVWVLEARLKVPNSRSGGERSIINMKPRRKSLKKVGCRRDFVFL